MIAAQDHETTIFEICFSILNPARRTERSFFIYAPDINVFDVVDLVLDHITKITECHHDVRKSLSPQVLDQMCDRWFIQKRD